MVVRKVKLRIAIAALLFILGLVCFVCWFVFPEHSKYLDLCGWMLWVLAYFAVLWENYRRKAPVPTRGGTVEFSKHPNMYRANYFLLFFMGAVAFLILVIFMVLRR